MKVEKYSQTRNTCTLYVRDIRKRNKINNCLDIIKRFISEKFYITLYRVDGVNLTDDEIVVYGKEIEKYFESNMHLEIIDGCKNSSSIIEFNSAVGQIEIRDNIKNILPKIFDYYLETIIVKPKTEFEVFKEIYAKNNSMMGLYKYIEEGLTDILFAYVDSGDFMICFNTSIYDEKVIANLINKMLIL